MEKTPYEQCQEEALKAIKEQKIDCASNGDVFRIDFCYPRLEGKIKYIRLGLSDVRAADSMLIEFDFERNGYSIKMDKIKFHDDTGDLPDILIENEEVAFIPAYNE